MNELKAVIGKLATGAALSFSESAEAFDHLTSRAVAPAQIGAFPMVQRVRGETVEELAGAAETLRAKMVRVSTPPDTIDVANSGADYGRRGRHHRQTRQPGTVFALWRVGWADRAWRQCRHQRRGSRR